METMTRKKRQPMSEINLVPYIDVMLVLLVIFMATAPFSLKGITVDLPRSNAKNLPANQDNSFVISISKAGNYSINYGKQHYAQVQLSKVLQLLEEDFSANHDTNILVNGDKESDYAYLINLLDALQKIGITNIGFITLPHTK